MAGILQPLGKQFPIINPDGTPTEYFIRWAQQRQIDIGKGITEAEAQALIDAWAAERDINAGVGLSGGGNLSSDMTIDLDAVLNDLNDVDTVTTPPTDGQALVWNDGDSLWEPGDVASGGGGGGAGAPWALISKVTVSTPTVNVDITDLGDYDELFLLIDNLALSTTGTRIARYSTDNGATWYSTSGDYKEYATSGVVTNTDSLVFHGSAGPSGRTAAAHIFNNLSGVPKSTHRVNVDSASPLVVFSPSLDKINAVRFTATAGNLISGDIYVLGRKAIASAGSLFKIAEFEAVGGETSHTFSGIPQTFDDLVFTVNGRGTAAFNDVAVEMRFNGDSGANYNQQQLFANGTGTAAVRNNASTQMRIVQVAAANSTANVFSGGTIELHDYTNSSRFKSAVGYGNNFDGTNIRAITGSGQWRSTNAITSITVFFSAGAFAAGTKIVLYGRGGSSIAKTPAMVLLASKTASGVANLDFTEFDNSLYSRYLLVGDNITVSVDTQLRLRVSTDGGSSFDTGANYTGAGYQTNQGTFSGNRNQGANTAFIEVTSPIESTAPANCSSLKIEMADPSVAGRKGFLIHSAVDANDGNFYSVIGAGRWQNSAAYNAVRLLPAAGTFSGNFQLFGYTRQ